MVINNEYINLFFDGIKKSKFQKVFIKPNCDPKYNLILDELESDNCKSFIKIDNLPRKEYLNLAFYSNYYVGNSSSGLYEIPYLKIPVINVGDRQKGRHESQNIINSKYDKLGEIIVKIEEDNFFNNKSFLNTSSLYKIYKSNSIFLEFLQNEFKV
jgi:UDP-N-acetylglucosamine 2-epimerase